MPVSGDGEGSKSDSDLDGAENSSRWVVSLMAVTAAVVAAVLVAALSDRSGRGRQETAGCSDAFGCDGDGA